MSKMKSQWNKKNQRTENKGEGAKEITDMSDAKIITKITTKLQICNMPSNHLTKTARA